MMDILTEGEGKYQVMILFKAGDKRARQASIRNEMTEPPRITTSMESKDSGKNYHA